MTPKISQEAIDLHDSYTHGQIPRREFLERLALVCGGVAASAVVLPFLEVNYAQASMIDEKDKRLDFKDVAIGENKGYWVFPKGKDPKKLAAVVIIHENKGLQPHIKDVARRMALEGFAVLAPDVIAAGTPADPDKAKEVMALVSPEKALQIFKTSCDKARELSNGKLGALGFCWGGAMSNQLAIHAEKLLAAVPFYGMQPRVEDVSKIQAPLMLHYGEKDERINKGIADFEAALKKYQKSYELFIYPGAQHAFHNDTAGDRYNADAAKLAWKRSVDFLKKHLEA